MFTQLQHATGIDCVLAGGSPVHETSSFGRDIMHHAGQLLHHGDSQIATARRCLSQRSRIEAFGPAAASNRFRGRPGNYARSGFGAGQRGLEVEHRLQGSRIAEERRTGGATQQRIQRRACGCFRHVRDPVYKSRS